MDFEQIVEEYQNWQDYETTPSRELKDSIIALSSNPSKEVDLFFKNIVSNFSEERDIFWLDKAVKYSQSASDKELALSYLTEIVSKPEKFGFIGSLLGSAATYIGMIAEYPDQTLVNILSDEIDFSTIKPSTVHFLKSSAYGAYIMTATDFYTGLNAGREMEASDTTPDLHMAEQFLSNLKGK